jgi:hypothetical protein
MNSFAWINFPERDKTMMKFAVVDLFGFKRPGDLMFAFVNAFAMTKCPSRFRGIRSDDVNAFIFDIATVHRRVYKNSTILDNFDDNLNNGPTSGN